MRIAVVGGGISGLSAAHLLAEAGHDVTCLEAAGRPGGLMRSQRLEGYLCESGPQAILDGAPEVKALIESAGLMPRVRWPLPAAKRRLVFIDGKLRALPAGPASLLSTDLLSAAGKWRLAREPFQRTPPPAEDESVFDFAARRGGPEAARKLAAPAVIGLFAGDATRLSVRSAFPRLAALEARHGSVIKGAKAARREGQMAGQSISFPDGIEELPRAVAALLGQRLVTARVTGLRAPSGTAGWTLSLEAGGTHAADAVVLALPPLATAELLDGLAPEAAAGLRRLNLASVAVVSLGFQSTNLGMDLEAYGFLVARGERPTLLGCQYESTVFPERAPPGGTLLRVLLGGTFEPALVDQDDATLVAKAVTDLGLAAGLSRQPDFSRVWRMRRVLPQYELGHEARAQAIEAAVSQLPGLHLLGMGLRGIGLSDCIRNATALARAFGPA